MKNGSNQHQPSNPSRNAHDARAAPVADAYLQFSAVNLNDVADCGAALLASSGTEYDTEPHHIDCNLQHLSLQRALGLEYGLAHEMREMISDKDLIRGPVPFDAVGTSQQRKRTVSEIIGSAENVQLSVREQNRANRLSKRRMLKCPHANSEVPDANEQNARQLGADGFISHDEPWPFHMLCMQLRQALLAVSWHVRHGAAIGLNAVATYHGSCLGAPVAALGYDRLNQNNAFSEDLSVRVCCVIALDRFDDYAAPSVVAPVRETCAKLLGTLSTGMEIDTLGNLVAVLLNFQLRKQWHVRHGSFLALKFILCVRMDWLEKQPLTILHSIVRGLGDPDEQVRAAAAETLAPLCSRFQELLGSNDSQLELARGSCWETIIGDGFIHVTAQSTIKLLGNLYSDCDPMKVDRGMPIESRIRHLLPFVRNHSSEVRTSAVQTVGVLIQHFTVHPLCHLQLQKLLVEIIGALYFSLVLELSDQLITSLFTVWRLCVDRLAAANILIAPTHLLSWLRLAATGAGNNFDESVLAVVFDGCVYTPNDSSCMHTDMVSASSCRLRCCEALGILVARYPPEFAFKLLNVAVSTLGSSRNGYQRQCVALLVAQSVSNIECQDAEFCLDQVSVHTLHSMCSTPYSSLCSGHCYTEIEAMDLAMKEQCHKMKLELEHALAAIDVNAKFLTSLCPDSIPAAMQLCTEHFERCFNLFKTCEKSKTAEGIQQAQSMLRQRELCAATIGYLTAEQSKIDIAVTSAAAAAIVATKCIPATLNPVLKALISSVKREHCKELQELASCWLVEIILWCVDNRKKKVAARIVHNICGLICDAKHDSASISKEALHLQGISNFDHDEILDEAAAQLASRGSKFVLAKLCKSCGGQLFDCVPLLQDLASSALKQASRMSQLSDLELVQALRVVTSIYPHINSVLRPVLLSLLAPVAGCLRYGEGPVLAPACQCLAMIATTSVAPVMNCVVHYINPMVCDMGRPQARLGAVRAIYEIALVLQLQLLPYTVLLAAPILRSMSDPCCAVRTTGAACFALLVNLMPLIAGVKAPENIPTSVSELCMTQRQFVEQLMGERPLEHYEVPARINTPLRTYQQQGIDWLAFLNKFNLHGVLCDDVRAPFSFLGCACVNVDQCCH